MSVQPMIQSSAMPPQPINTLQPTATSPMNSAYIASQQQTKAQMSLIGSSKGGAPVVQVPPVSSSAPNPGQTSDNYKALTQLAQTQQAQSTFDNAKTPQQTAALQQQQETLYKSGGSKRSAYKRSAYKRSAYKRGGSWPKWTCLSGGRRTKKRVRNTKRKSRKSRKGRKSITKIYI
jgi:hypothetical protein